MFYHHFFPSLELTFPAIDIECVMYPEIHRLKYAEYDNQEQVQDPSFVLHGLRQTMRLAYFQ